MKSKVFFSPILFRLFGLPATVAFYFANAPDSRLLSIKSHYTLSREKCKMLHRAQQTAREQKRKKSCIRNYLHYSWVAFFRFAAIQLERNHDKLMQKRGIKRFKNSAVVHQWRRMSRPLSFNYTAKHRHQGTAPFNYNALKTPAAVANFAGFSFNFFCFFKRCGSSGLLNSREKASPQAL